MNGSHIDGTSTRWTESFSECCTRSAVNRFTVGRLVLGSVAGRPRNPAPIVPRCPLIRGDLPRGRSPGRFLRVRRPPSVGAGDGSRGSRQFSDPLPHDPARTTARSRVRQNGSACSLPISRALSPVSVMVHPIECGRTAAKSPSHHLQAACLPISKGLPPTVRNEPGASCPPDEADNGQNGDPCSPGLFAPLRTAAPRG